MERIKLVTLLLLGLVLSGCAGHHVPKHARFTSYSDFRPGPENGVDLVWARIGLRDADRLKRKLARYDSVVIDQVLIVSSDDLQGNEQVDEITQYLIDAISKKINHYKPVVQKPTKNSLRLSIAISNVKTPNPILAVTSSILPYGLAISTIKKVVTGEHSNVGEATIELLVSDANTHRPLFAAIDREAGNKDFSTMIDSLDDAKDAIDWWVERLGVTLNNWQSPT